MNFNLAESNDSDLERLKNQGELEMNWWGAPNYDNDDVTVRTLLIKDNDKEIGIIGFEIFHDIQNYMTISEFEILKSCRNQGYGKRFISELVDANEYNIEINPLNEKVKEFWKQIGFIEMDDTIMRYDKK